MKKTLVALISVAALAGCSTTRHRNDTSAKLADHATTVDSCGVGNYTFDHLRVPCAPPARARSASGNDEYVYSNEDSIGTSESNVDFDSYRPESQIDLTQEVLFRRGSAQLTRDAQDTLDDVAWMIRENEDHIAQINIEGHAMENGTPARSLALSRSRAAAVKNYLVNKGVDPELLTTQGYGETRPKFNASNASQDELERNERVDFTVETYND